MGLIITRKSAVRISSLVRRGSDLNRSIPAKLLRAMPCKDFICSHCKKQLHRQCSSLKCGCPYCTGVNA